MKKKKHTAGRVLAAALSTAFAVIAVPVQAFAEQIPPTEESALVTESETTAVTVITEETSETESLPSETQETQPFVQEQFPAPEEEPPAPAPQEEPEIPQEYQLSVNMPEAYQDLCQMTVNGSAEPFTVRVGDTVWVKLHINDREDCHYVLQTLKFGSVSIGSESAGQTDLETSVQITEAMLNDQNIISVTPELTQYYIVKFSYDPTKGNAGLDRNYTVSDESTETNTVGSVRLNQDEQTGLTAIPAENYRVAAVTIDGYTSKFNENNYIYARTLEANQNHDVTVMFALNQYQISGGRVDDTASVTFCIHDGSENFNPASKGYGRENALIDYGRTAVCCIKPERGYVIRSVTVNGVPRETAMKRNSDGYYLFSLENITQDTRVEVEVAQQQAVSLTLPELPAGTSCYASDVTLTLNSPDGTEKFISGEYWLEGSQERQPIDMTTKTITIPKEHNASGIVVHAEIQDQLGQTVRADSEPFSINSVTPQIGITISGDRLENSESMYYADERTAVIQIDDRKDTLPALEELVKCFRITKNQQELSDQEKIFMLQYQKEKVSRLTVDGQTYDRAEVILHFTEEAEYDWSFDYTNLAGMHGIIQAENGEDLRKFVIDRTAPDGVVKVSGREWYQTLFEKLTFGLYSNTNLTVTAEISDLYPQKIEIYQSRSKELLSWEALQSVQDWTAYETAMTLENPDYYIIYARLTDKAGNQTYLSSNGLIIDQPREDGFTFRVTDTDGNPFTENRLCTGDLPVHAEVQENGVTSGLSKIEYQIFSETEQAETSEKFLVWQFTNETPEFSQLVFRQDVNFTIPAEEYEGMHLILRVIATDNAGNTEYQDQVLNLDSHAPEISFRYLDSDGNAVQPRHELYFNQDVRAVLHVEEQNFNQEKFIDSVRINQQPLREFAPDGFSWVTEDHENHVYELSIPFSEENHYQIDVDYTDNAENNAQAQKEFVIDKTNPSGTARVKGNLLGWLLEKISFGVFSNHDLSVEMNGSDTGSGLEKMEYYLWNTPEVQDETAASLEEIKAQQLEWLKALPESDWTLYESPVSVAQLSGMTQGLFIRVTDQAGNQTYIQYRTEKEIQESGLEDYYIFDNNQCNIAFTVNDVARAADANMIYNDDVNIEIKITDPKPYSGIRSVKYEVRVAGEPADIQGFYESGAGLQTEVSEDSEIWTGNILLPKDDERFNSSDVTVFVEAVDYTGNVSQETLKLDIDTTAPEIEIRFDNNNGTEDPNDTDQHRWYFHDNRTAYITFKERNNHFSKEAALNSIHIQDVVYEGDTGNHVNLHEAQWTENLSGGDEDTHTLMIEFKDEANYILDLAGFADLAGNAAVTTVEENTKGWQFFTIDRTAPEGYVAAASAEGREELWRGIVNPLHFGFWSKSNIHISCGCGDYTSHGTIRQEYYRSSSTTALTEADLQNITNWTSFSTLDLNSNGYCTVYVRLTDLAGNRSYLSTDALIVDDTAPYDEMMPPEISLVADQIQSNIYNGDVSVKVTVDDPAINDAYSGLSTVTYRIITDGIETDNGSLYQFDAVAPQHEDLLKTWDGTVSISSANHNSNNIVLEVYAQDNARNATVQYLDLSIDATAPQIAVAFDNNSPRNELFKNGRTARINIAERNFNKDLVTLTASHNGTEYQPAVVWRQGGGSGDGTVWTADVPFSDDGDYTFSISCTDLAGNQNGEIQFAAGTVSPGSFTVDATAPKITVDFSDTDENPENNYYKSSRTARITIDELNFNPETAASGITVRGTDDGEPVNLSVGQWQDNGTQHTAQIAFTQDAEYHLSVAYTDQAGNAGNGYSSDFYLDTIDPAVNLTVNGESGFNAYGKEETILPVLQWQDTNLDSSLTSISLSGINVEVSEPEYEKDTVSFELTAPSGEVRIWKAKTEDILNHSGQVCGKIMTFEDFPSDSGKDSDKIFDDIYTFSVTAQDKAGRIADNPEKTTQTFSVNRFGSTYNTVQVKPILGQYNQEAKEIVVSEINPNALKEYSVTLFKNNETITLEKEKDYDVETVGTEKEWHEYTYHLHKDLFEDDGSYEIQFHSVDKAGNASSNANDEKDSVMNFMIDKTPPTAFTANLEEKRSYYIDENQLAVLIMANDNLKLTEVSASLDGENKWHWNEQEIESEFSDGEFTVEVEAEPLFSSKSHELKVICKDASGRETELVVDDFKVIKNDPNRFLYLGVGVGGVAAAAAVVAVVRRRKKSNADQG